jgi:hypothetical protein
MKQHLHSLLYSFFKIVEPDCGQIVLAEILYRNPIFLFGKAILFSMDIEGGLSLKIKRTEET